MTKTEVEKYVENHVIQYHAIITKKNENYTYVCMDGIDTFSCFIVWYFFLFDAGAVR